ncbi:MAG TPA: potassium/proton antiporter [Gammaproteobacteria bacterium]
MEWANHLILFGGLLFLLNILATTLSPRLGVPLSLAFLVTGMLAGEEGLGGFHYDDVQSAYLIGSLALAVILFDGGLRTDVRNFRVALRPSILLATIGVILTTAVCGLFASWILDLPLTEGMLIGAIVGSTDAAAVFSVLNMQGLSLKSRVAATLEIESGINDPMAIFLTIVLVEFLSAGQPLGISLLGVFVWQMGAGGIMGILGGRLLAYGVSRLTLSPGLYPLLVLFGGVSIFGLTAVMGGSGFVAVYLAGLIVGNRLSRGLYDIQRFHDGIASLAQISLFVILGLLVTPSELLPYASGALAVALVLIFVARPIAVGLCLLPFRFGWREQMFISWVGLRGAVPIVLAMFPWLAGLEQWHLFFNIAFFIVLVSLVLQGATVAPFARWLDLQVPSASSRVQRVELGIPEQADYELVGYRLADNSPVINSSTDMLPLPGNSRPLCILREGRVLEPTPDEPLQAKDLVYLFASPRKLSELDEIFVGDGGFDEQAFFGEFILSPHAKLAKLSALYGFSLPPEHEDWSIGRYIYSKYPQPVVGDRVRLGPVEFVVREMSGARLKKVGLKLPH